MMEHEGQYVHVMHWQHHPQCAVAGLKEITPTGQLEKLCTCKPKFHTSDQAHKAIKDSLLQECVDQFNRKANDYKGNELTGAKGQYADLVRKINKLRLSVWEEENLIHESAEEVTRDMFGTVLLMLYCLRVGYLK